MKVGHVATSNTKGQIVIPKEYRDALGISTRVLLNLTLSGASILVTPVRGIIEKIVGEQSYMRILERTKGAWKGDSWMRTRMQRQRKEKAVAKRRRGAW